VTSFCHFVSEIFGVFFCFFIDTGIFIFPQRQPQTHTIANSNKTSTQRNRFLKSQKETSTKHTSAHLHIVLNVLLVILKII